MFGCGSSPGGIEYESCEYLTIRKPVTCPNAIKNDYRGTFIVNGKTPDEMKRFTSIELYDSNSNETIFELPESFDEDGSAVSYQCPENTKGSGFIATWVYSQYTVCHNL